MRAALALLLVGCAADPPTPDARKGSDWPHFLGPNRDGSSPETGIRTAWPRDGLPKLWSCELGEGYGPPTVAAGRLFHADIVDKRHRLTCRDAASGKELWRFGYPTDYRDQYGYHGSRCCPTVDGDRVYLYGPEGMLYCVAAADGKEAWKLDTKAAYRFHPNFFGVGSCPVVEGDLLLIAVGGSPPGPRPVDLRDVKPNGSAIVALDKRTGAERYRVGDDLASYATPVVIDFNGKRLGLHLARGGLLGFDPATGTQAFRYKWRAKTEESVNAANPVVVGDRVFISECYEVGSALLKLEPTGVREVWTDKAKGRDEKSLLAHWNTPVHHDGFVYASSGRHANDADIRCVELATGDVKWVERRTTRCTLLKIDGHLLGLSEQGELRLFKLNPAKYEEVARWECPDLEYPAWAPPVVSRGRLYVRGKDRLACYDLRAK